jgi:hypothetical protein
VVEESDAERSARAYDSAEQVVEKTQKTSRRGCITAVGGTTAAILILVAVAFIFGGDGDDDAAEVSSKCRALGVPTGEVALPTGDECADSTEDGTPDPGDGGDVSAFAGHYVLTEGLDNPNGHDTQPLDPGAYDISVRPAAASFDVDESGTITGGEIRTSFVGTGDPGTCTWTLAGDQAAGSLALTGPGASGQLTYTGEITVDGPCSTGTAMPATRIMQLGIVGDDVVLCYIAMGADLTSCSTDDPGVAGRFTRQ